MGAGQTAVWRVKVLWWLLALLVWRCRQGAGTGAGEGAREGDGQAARQPAVWCVAVAGGCLNDRNSLMLIGVHSGVTAWYGKANVPPARTSNSGNILSDLCRE